MAAAVAEEGEALAAVAEEEGLAVVAVVACRGHQAVVVVCRGHRVAFRVAAAECRDLQAGLRRGHRAAFPEHQDLRLAALHRSIVRVLELHDRTWELAAGRDLHSNRELGPTLALGRDWRVVEALVLDHRLCHRLAPPLGLVRGRALDLGHRLFLRLVQGLESLGESELASERGLLIVRETHCRGLEVATQDLVFPIRGLDFRTERQIVRKHWKTAEAV